MANLIRATNLWGYDELLIQRGEDPLPLLARHNIPAAAQRDDQSFLVYRDMAALFEDTAKTLNFPELGLRLAEFQGHLHCPALKLNYIPGMSGKQRTVRLNFTIEDGNGPYQLQAYELSLANMRQVMTLLCGEDFRPLSVHFMHDRASDKTIYDSVFQCPSHFRQPWCGFELPEAAFSLPLSSADHQTWQLAEHYLAAQQAPNPVSMTENVVRLIHTLLPINQCHSEVIAAELSMHKRTMQRKLKSEGTTFEEILSQERQALATRYLADPNMPFSQIAGLLGYSEQSAFNRACRVWFGKTPRQYRLEHASD